MSKKTRTSPLSKLEELRTRAFPARSRRQALLQRWVIEPLRRAGAWAGRRRSAPAWRAEAAAEAARSRALRRALRRRPRGEPVAARPRILFVLQDAAGGVRETHRDLMSHLHRRLECLVLAGSLHRVSLYRYNAARPAMDLLRTWWLHRAWSQRRARDAAYRTVYLEVLERLGIDLVHVRHLLGHSLDLVDVCRERGIPVVLSFHDFYLACPSIHLLDDTGTYCGGRCTKTAGQCRLPVAWLRDLPVLKQGHLARWRRDVAAVLPQVSTFVTTSQTARRVMTGVYPELAGRVRVIEHGRDFATAGSLAVEPRPGRRVRILVPGNLAFHKGADFVRRLVALDRRRADRLEIHVLGRAPRDFRGLAVCHGPYRREELAGRARRIAPSFVGIFSVWPETYCHTLTEAWALGVPVLASDIGTLRERILARGGGWLLPVHDVELAYCRILEIAGDREGYRRQRELAHVRGLPTVRDMGEAYRKIYGELLGASV